MVTEGVKVEVVCLVVHWEDCEVTFAIVEIVKVEAEEKGLDLAGLRGLKEISPLLHHWTKGVHARGSIGQGKRLEVGELPHDMTACETIST